LDKLRIPGGSFVRLRGLRSKPWEEDDMIPASFEYHRPRSLDEAIAILASHGDDIRIVAGGHSLIPMMKLRLAQPGHLVDLQDLGELRGIDAGSTIVIGAMTTQHALITSAALAATVPLLRETSLQIADPQVRYCGTLGGNVANGDPGNDMPAAMMALNASYRVKGEAGERDIPARDFYQGAYATSLGEGEILTSIRIPAPADGHGYAYEKQKRKIGDYATAAAAVVLTLSGGKCNSAAIALTNVADTPLLATEAAVALIGTSLDDTAIAEAARRAQAIAKPSSDGRGPADFRAHVAGVMVKRAIARAGERAA
jgi:carbon-monoxide dehydrogenase medium subunit